MQNENRKKNATQFKQNITHETISKTPYHTNIPEDNGKTSTTVSSDELYNDKPTIPSTTLAGDKKTEISTEQDHFHQFSPIGNDNKNSFAENTKEMNHKEGGHKANYDSPFQIVRNNSVYNNIPIGIINPDRLPSHINYDNNFTTSNHEVKPSLLEHLLEYHHYQESQSSNNPPHQPLPFPPPQQENHFHVNNIEPSRNTPQLPINFKHQPHLVPNQNINVNARPFQINKNVPNQNNFHHGFNLFPQAKPESPPHYVTVFNGIPNGHYQPPNTLVPNPNPHYVSPEELYLVESKDKALPLPKQPNQHPYLTGHRNNINVHDHSPNLGLKLEDIIDNIKNHEETDSHASDVHVLLLQPQNYGQGLFIYFCFIYPFTTSI